MGLKNYEVPSKDYAEQYRQLMPAIRDEISRVFLEENPVLGDSVVAFENAFAAHTGVRHAVGVNSGTDALVLALRVLDLEPGDEVVVPANTFFATITAVNMAGARPVLVDPDPDTLNLTAAGVTAAITDRTRVLLPVHLYGRLAPMTELVELADLKGLHVVEDAAQAHGAADAAGRRAGAFGNLGCFSFHPSKNLGAFGDGGIITTDNTETAATIRCLRNLGKVDKYHVGHIAPNSKLDTLQAAILRIKLTHLDAWNNRRRAIAGRYQTELAGVGDLDLPDNPGGEAHVYHLFVIRTEAREALRIHLRAGSINAGIHYPVPPHLQAFDPDHKAGDFPVTEAAARTVLSLPVSWELTDRQIDLVISSIRDFFGC